MSVTCGFYNSISGDRKYTAEQISSIFDGIITDGVFYHIGNRFSATAGGGNVVNIDTGKCWFNHSWTYNDTVLQITCSESDSLRDRIDAIVVKVNSSDLVRNNTIEFVPGMPSTTNPTKPEFTSTENIHYYPICYIYRSAGSTEITDGNITYVVGTSEAPYITAPLDKVGLDEHLIHWHAQLTEFVAQEKAEFDAVTTTLTANMENTVNSFIEWTAAQEGVIDDWFDSVKNKLGEDAAIDLQIQIDESDIERWLVCGLPNGTKTFSTDGSVIRTINPAGMTLTKTFSSDFSSCTTILKTSNGGELGRLIKNFSSDGSTISSELTIF